MSERKRDFDGTRQDKRPSHTKLMKPNQFKDNSAIIEYLFIHNKFLKDNFGQEQNTQTINKNLKIIINREAMDIYREMNKH